MPRLAAHVYAAHQAAVLKLASRDGGISRADIADELNISKAVADSIIKKAGLVPVGKQGRTQLFKAPATNAPKTDAPKADELPPEVKDAAVASAPEVKDADLDELAHIDDEIVDTRTALREAAAKAGEALGVWATNSALVDALRERLTKLATRRMEACS